MENWELQITKQWCTKSETKSGVVCVFQFRNYNKKVTGTNRRLIEGPENLGRY